MRKVLYALAVLALLGAPARADYTATQGTGTTFGSVVVTAKHYAQQLLCDVTTPSQCAAVDASGILTVKGTVTANFGTLNGAATAANQASVIGTKAPGTAATNSSLLGAIYTSAGISLTDGQQAALQFDSTGNLKVSGVGVAQGSTTSGQTLSLVGAAAATSVPTTTAGNTYPLSMDVLGGLRTSTLNNGVGATGAAVPANAVSNGCRAQSAEASAATAGNLTAFACDLVGKLVNLPYANPELTLNGQITSAMTATTSTAVTGMGAQGAGVRNYVTSCTFSNSHATVGTMMLLQDGSGGTTLWQSPAAALFGGATVVFPTPIKTTANTALFAANVTTGANTFLSCSGYKGA